MIKKYETIGKAFEEKVENLESIFSSFRDLHGMYAQIMKTANVNANSLVAFERLTKSANTEQTRISNGLYAQGYILLTGTAEALLKDVFDSLLIENFTSIKVASGINFSSKEVQEVMIASKDGLDSYEHLNAAFGRLVRQKLYKDIKNPTEKINFQNAQTMVETFLQYFGIVLNDSSNTNSIHRHWQVRHCIVHNNSVIDERFVHNVRIVNLLKSSEKVGKVIVIKKSDYQQAKADFLKLFESINIQIESLNLQSRFAESYAKK